MSERLEDIAVKMMADGKGLLAADESTSTIKKRFDTIGLESTETSRRDYREMLFRSDEAMKNTFLASFSMKRPCIRKQPTARLSLISSRPPAPSPASRSIPAPSQWPVSRAKP